MLLQIWPLLLYWFIQTFSKLYRCIKKICGYSWMTWFPLRLQCLKIHTTESSKPILRNVFCFGVFYLFFLLCYSPLAWQSEAVCRSTVLPVPLMCFVSETVIFVFSHTFAVSVPVLWHVMQDWSLYAVEATICTLISRFRVQNLALVYLLGGHVLAEKVDSSIKKTPHHFLKGEQCFLAASLLVCYMAWTELNTNEAAPYVYTERKLPHPIHPLGQLGHKISPAAFPSPSLGLFLWMPRVLLTLILRAFSSTLLSEIPCLSFNCFCVSPQAFKA